VRNIPAILTNFTCLGRKTSGWPQARGQWACRAKLSLYDGADGEDVGDGPIILIKRLNRQLGAQPTTTQAAPPRGGRSWITLAVIGTCCAGPAPVGAGFGSPTASAQGTTAPAASAPEGANDKEQLIARQGGEPANAAENGSAASSDEKSMD